MVRRGAKKAASRLEISPPVTTPDSPSPVVSEVEEDAYYKLAKAVSEDTDYGNTEQYTSIEDLWKLDGNPVVEDTRSLPGDSQHQEETTLLSYLVPINTDQEQVDHQSGQMYTLASASTSGMSSHHLSTHTTTLQTPHAPLDSSHTTAADSCVSTKPAHVSEDPTKKRHRYQATGTEKKKRAKKAKTTAVVSDTMIPLTASVWPSKDHLPEPIPTRLFFPSADTNVEIEVYSSPQHPGVSLRHYPNAPYAKRINLNVSMYKNLREKAATILDHVERIQKEADRGMLDADCHVEDLDTTGSTQVLINLYKGRAKVHIGTSSYISEMRHCPKFAQRLPKSPIHCGSTVSIHVIREIQERVGRALANYDWCDGLSVPVVVS